jgi:hypothetical protein
VIGSILSIDLYETEMKLERGGGGKEVDEDEV